MIVGLSLFVLASALATPPLPSLRHCAPALRRRWSAPLCKRRRRCHRPIDCIADCGISTPRLVQRQHMQRCEPGPDLSGGPGHVTCDARPSTVPPFTNGTFRNITTGPICSCEDGQTTRRIGTNA